MSSDSRDSVTSCIFQMPLITHNDGSAHSTGRLLAASSLGQLSPAGLFISWKYNPSLLWWIGIAESNNTSQLKQNFNVTFCYADAKSQIILLFVKQIMFVQNIMIYLDCFPFRSVLTGSKSQGLGSFLSQEEREIGKSGVSGKWTLMHIGDSNVTSSCAHTFDDTIFIWADKKLSKCHFAGSLARPATSLNPTSSPSFLQYLRLMPGEKT